MLIKDENVSQIDLDGESRQLNSEARLYGREAGVKNQNDPDISVSNEHDLALRCKTANIKNRYDRYSENEMSKIDAEIRNRIEQVEGFNPDDWVDTAEQDINVLITALKAPMEALAIELVQANRCYKVIVDKYGGEVDSNRIGSYLLVIAGLLVSLLLESYLIGGMFGQAHELGHIGGAVQAFAISAFSISVSFNWGVILWRAINGSRLNRLLGSITTIVFFALLVSYHSIVAWYRTGLVYGDDPSKAATTAISYFLKNGIVMYDVESAFLVLIGVFFAILACCTGYRSNQAKIVVANARIVRERELTQAKFDKTANEKVLQIKKRGEHIGRKLDTQYEIVVQATDMLNLVINKGMRLDNTYQATTQQIQDIGEQALQIYRSTCNFVEGTHPSFLPNDQYKITIEDNFKLDMSTVEEGQQQLQHMGKRSQIFQSEYKAAKKNLGQLTSKSMIEAMELIEKIRQAADQRKSSVHTKHSDVADLPKIIAINENKEVAHV